MNKAFTLLELAIVLAIIGLIAGGVVAGSSLIRSAEVKSVSKDMAQYNTAILLFKNKYKELPGDMYNATEFWGAQDGGDGVGSDCTSSPSTTAATCNGNGDGIIQWGSEMMRFWQHLGNEGLISGTYSGVGTNTVSNDNCDIGVSCPAMTIQNVTAQIRHQGVFDNTDAHRFAGTYNHLYYIGDASGVDQNPHNPFLTTSELWSIDKKLDDGLPAKGNVRTYKNGAPTWAATAGNCATTADSNTAEYDLTRDDIVCSIILITGF